MNLWDKDLEVEFTVNVQVSENVIELDYNSVNLESNEQYKSDIISKLKEGKFDNDILQQWYMY